MAMPTGKTMMEAWKRQLDAALRLTEAVIEGSQRMREVQNAASIAGLILTTDCMIAQMPQKPSGSGGDAGLPE